MDLGVSGETLLKAIILCNNDDRLGPFVDRWMWVQLVQDQFSNIPPSRCNATT